jgi:hypothetical protein
MLVVSSLRVKIRNSAAGAPNFCFEGRGRIDQRRGDLGKRAAARGPLGKGRPLNVGWVQLW